MSYKLPNRTLVSQNDSAMIESPTVPRSRFTGSWSHRKTFDAGLLVPFMVDEILPGDQMSYDVTAYVRMATPLFPLMDNQRIDTFFFFVPHRLVWDNWVRFMGEQDSPASSIAFTIPQIISPTSGFAVGSLYDHLGLPTVGVLAASTISINALPLRSYELIYREWFRDQNLQANTFAELTGNGPDPFGNYSLRPRAKSHDYFTSALPWPQKFTAPSIPLTGQAPVSGIGVLGTSFPVVPSAVAQTAPLPPMSGENLAATSVANNVYIRGTSSVGQPEVYAELGEATATFTVNALRQAFLVQQLLERDARGGTRYIELIKSHFGVTSPDARLQRPEYIGGGSTPLNVTPVAQTAPTAGVPVGALGAAATAVGNHRANYASTEHGFIIGLINVKTELSYSQGIHKMWSRSTRYDYYWPSLAQLGEQAILRREIFARGTSDDDIVFGYQERWQEYRTRTSEVTGLFRPTSTGNIAQWHLSQQFLSAPVLGNDFIIDNPPMARVLAAGALAVNQQYLADIHIKRNAVRPIPSYGTPVTLGRF